MLLAQFVLFVLFSMLAYFVLFLVSAAHCLFGWSGWCFYLVRFGVAGWQLWFGVSVRSCGIGLVRELE